MAKIICQSCKHYIPCVRKTEKIEFNPSSRDRDYAFAMICEIWKDIELAISYEKCNGFTPKK
jgi:hypothetical protein